ncbi:MAG: SH3 domain-containing protein [Candidatus Promineofilum sp.]|mgnify:CR=1 FL=1|jgi:hypothetical protein|nr:SH3 domain-containing protein [Promineifilum sp.]
MHFSSRRTVWLVAAFALAIVGLLALGGRPAAAQSAEDLWFGQFWQNQNLSGDPVLTRWDRTIDFRWFGGSPDSRLDGDNFSVRWTRNVAFAAGNYRFNATMDDGMRVWINDQLIIDNWTRSQEHTVSVDRFIPAGVHRVRVEHFEDGGQATAIFTWDLIGPEDAGPQFPNWRGVYFNTPNLTGTPVLVRDDRYLNQNWGEASPGPGVNADFWSARWTRQVAVQPGRYRVVATSDDGSRVWVNNQLVIDNWIDQTTTRSAEIMANGNVANVVVEYYDNWGPAFLQVDLVPLGGPAIQPPGPAGNCTVAPTALQAQVNGTIVLNVRRGPSTQFEVLTQLQPCTIVPMSGFRSTDSQWVQVIVPNGQTGWVNAQYVATGVPVSSLSTAAR